MGNKLCECFTPQEKENESNALSNHYSENTNVIANRLKQNENNMVFSYVDEKQTNTIENNPKYFLNSNFKQSQNNNKSIFDFSAQNDQNLNNKQNDNQIKPQINSEFNYYREVEI